MKYNLRRRMSQFTVCVLALGLLAGLMPFGNERAYAGTGGVIDTVAGGEYGDLTDVPAIGATLANPSAVTIDMSGNLYIADTGNNKIKRVDATTHQISTVAGRGDYHGELRDGGPALDAGLSSPAGVAMDAAGNLYIADKYNDRIRKVDAVTGHITTVAGGGVDDGDDGLGDNGPAVDAILNSPSGVAVDGDGNLYIADTDHHKIRKVDFSSGTGIITTVAGEGYGTYRGDGGPAVAAEINYPSAVVVDSDGNLYIADTYNNRIRKVDFSSGIGMISTVAGSTKVDGFGGDGSPAIEAQLNEPEGVTIDSRGNLYIADTDNNRIRKVTPNGIIMTIAGTGAGDYSGDEGPGTQAKLYGPRGLALGSGGNLYIADYFNYAIRMQTEYTPASDASLAGIALSSGALSPAFAPGTTSYTATVVNGVSSIRVTPTTTDSLMSVKVNGERVASGTQSGDINLDVGDNAVTVVAVAEDGTTEKPYTIIVKREVSSNANLSQLSLSSGTLSPTFISTTTTYSATASLREITVTPVLSDPLAAVKVDGTPVENGTASQPIPLSLGSVNPIAIVVTAQNGTTKTYTVNVTRAISANADLSGLSLSSGTLTPVGADSYTASVGNSESSITVTPTAADGSATVTVNDAAVASGTASASLPLVVGSNTITVMVMAENGTTKKSYTITVTRAESSNADLSDLTLPGAVLTPSFLPGTYKTSVDYSVNSVTVTPTVSDAVYAAAQVSLYDGSGVLAAGPIAVPSGTASPSLPLAIGSNTVTVLVTAQDGTTKTYTVTVTRGASSNADLSNLTLSNGALTPAFAGTYTASVDHSVSSVTVTPTLSDAANASATASLYDGSGTLASGPHAVASGTASPALPLSVGDNVIKVVVTAQDGATRTYTVTVTREDARSGNGQASLSGFALSHGTLSPAFAPGTVQYTASVGASVSSVTVTMMVPDADKAMSVASIYNSAGALISGPFAMTSGTAAFSLPLNAGSNAISIVVTSQGGTDKSYALDITRAAPNTPVPAGGGGGGGVFVNKPVIDLMGKSLDPAGIDTKKPFVTLELTPKDSVAYAGVPASVLTDLAARNADFYLELRTPYGFYQVPANLASIIPGFDALLANNRLKAEDVSFKITLTDKSGDKQLLTRIHSVLPDGELLGAVADFHIDIVHTNTGLTVGAADLFDKEIARLIPLPKYRTAMPELWGAFRYNATTKAFEFVPARAVQIDGAWYVKISSYSNSTYIAVENAASFADVQGHWSQSFVEQAAAKGLVAGVGGGRYDPDKVVTRAEFTAMLVRALGRGTSTGSEVPYRDVQEEAWYFSAVKTAKDLGLIAIAKGGEFKPEQPITREEMASMLAGVIRLEKLPMTLEYVSLQSFADIGKVNAAYLEDVRLMVKLHIMSGISATTFDPRGISTRAQAAVVCIRMLQELGYIDRGE